MSFSREILDFKLKCNKIRSLVMWMINHAGSGHPGPSLSCVEICLALYEYIMRHNPMDPRWEKRDRFILSKGHAAPTLYAVLAVMGYIEESELATLRTTDSRLQGHPDMTMLDCIEFSTGSLGKGISAGIGIAEALKYRAGKRTPPFSQKYSCLSDELVYVLAGDGELDEGIAKEALAYAGAKRLSNYVLIIDHNGHQLSGKKENILDTSPIESHFNQLQWQIINKYKGGIDLNGHDYTHIRWAFNEVLNVNNRPAAIIFKTIKGKGVPFMEDDAAYHGTPPMDHELRTLTTNYDACLKKESASEKKLSGIFDIYDSIIKHRIIELDKHDNIELEISDKLSPRDCVGKALAKEALVNENIISVYSDLKSSCKGDYFSTRFPERTIEVGIAESLMNMMGGGLASEGLIPFTNTFSIFQLESLGALRQIAYNSLNVKVLGSHGDPRLQDGGSHAEIELISALRGMPNWHIFWPSDGIMAYMLVSHLSSVKGPCFMKYSRNKIPVIYNSKPHLGIKLKNELKRDDINAGYVLLKDFEKRNSKRVTVIAAGDLVYESIRAVNSLSAFENIDIRIIDYFRLKPASTDILADSAKEGPIVTAEAGSINGGLFSLVCEQTSAFFPVKVLSIGLKDEFIKSGNYDELTEKHAIGSRNIADAVLRIIK